MKWLLNGSAEKICKRYYEAASSSAWSHTQTSARYRDFDKTYAIPRIVLSSVIGSTAVALEYIRDQTIKSYCLLGIGVLGGLNSLVGAVQLYLGYGEKTGQHRQIAESWSALARSIELCLMKPLSDRQDADHFISEIGSTFSRLTESSPTIPTRVISQFKYEFQDWIAEGHSVAQYLNGVHTISAFQGGDEGDCEMLPVAPAPRDDEKGDI